jgi:hypothetical protein
MPEVGDIIDAAGDTFARCTNCNSPNHILWDQKYEYYGLGNYACNRCHSITQNIHASRQLTVEDYFEKMRDVGDFGNIEDEVCELVERVFEFPDKIQRLKPLTFDKTWLYAALYVVDRKNNSVFALDDFEDPLGNNWEPFLETILKIMDEASINFDSLDFSKDIKLSPSINTKESPQELAKAVAQQTYEQYGSASSKMSAVIAWYLYSNGDGYFRNRIINELQEAIDDTNA